MVKRGEIMDKLAHMLGGRVAEEIRFDDITTGASNDLQRATETTRRMITQYGMSENLGPLTFGHDPAQPFVGRDYGMGQEYSEETAQKIDAEIRRVIDEAYAKASRILRRAPGRARPDLAPAHLARDHRPRRVRSAAGGRGPGRGVQGEGREAGQEGRGDRSAKSGRRRPATSPASVSRRAAPPSAARRRAPRRRRASRRLRARVCPPRWAIGLDARSARSSGVRPTADELGLAMDLEKIERGHPAWCSRASARTVDREGLAQDPAAGGRDVRRDPVGHPPGPRPRSSRRCRRTSTRNWC